MLLVNWIDRMNYLWSINMIIYTWILLGIEWLFGAETLCRDERGVQNNMENVCMSYLYIPNTDPIYQNREVGAYRWYYFYPAVVITICYILGHCWEQVTAWNLLEILRKIEGIERSQSENLKGEMVRYIVPRLLDWMKTDAGILLTAFHYAIKLMTVFAALYILFLMSSLLGESFFWPIDVWIGVPIFPLFTTCQFLWDGTKYRDVLSCVHPMKSSYQLAYLIQWFWFAAVVVVNAVDLILAIAGCGTHHRYGNTVRGYLKETKDAGTFIRLLRPDAVLIFSTIQEHCGPSVTKKILHQLQKEYEGAITKEII